MGRSSFGSISKRGNAWRIQWTDAVGNRMSRTVHGTRDDAVTELARIKLYETGGDRRTTYAEYWNAVVWPSCADLKQKTRDTYNQTWRHDLEPRIGNREISATNRRMVDRVLSDIESPSGKRHAHALWKKICRMAYLDEIIDRVPLDRTNAPKQSRTRARAILAASEVPSWLKSITGQKYEALALCCLGGGLRPEEAYALCKSDVTDLDGYALVDVSKTLVQTYDGKLLQQSTKTDDSTREVVIGAPFASRLLELCQGADSPLVPSRPGMRPPFSEVAYTAPQTIARNWKDWCVRNDVQHIPFGNMRSIYSTLHGEAETLDSLVSFALGHSGSTTKERNYQQRTRKSLMLVADSLAEYIEEQSR